MQSSSFLKWHGGSLLWHLTWTIKSKARTKPKFKIKLTEKRAKERLNYEQLVGTFVSVLFTYAINLVTYSNRFPPSPIDRQNMRIPKAYGSVPCSWPFYLKMQTSTWKKVIKLVFSLVTRKRFLNFSKFFQEKLSQILEILLGELQQHKRIYL